jgi:hypothetical protein
MLITGSSPSGVFSGLKRSKTGFAGMATRIEETNG